MSPVIRFKFAIYLLTEDAKHPEAMAKAAVAKGFPAVKLVDQIPDRPTEQVVRIWTQDDVRKMYAPPSLESLAYCGYGLSDEQKRALQKSRRAIILDFAHPKEKVWVGLHNANQIVEQLANETGGLVWDEETREVFTATEWNARRLSKWAEEIPAVETQTTLDVYPKGEFERAITLGMAKIGLPDVVVEDVVRSSDESVEILINIFCQALAEGASPRVPGPFTIDLKAIRNASVREPQLKSLQGNATGKGYLQLKVGTTDEGDPKNRLIQLAFDRYEGVDPPEKLHKMITCFLGTHDSVNHIEHTEELLEASRKAKAELPALKMRFNAQLQPGELILLKAPFKTSSGGNEWMWMEVTRWKSERIRGVLDNDPEQIPELRAGAIVEINQEDVFDYIHEYPDGRKEGNSTGKIIEKMAESPASIPASGVEAIAEKLETPDCSPR